MSFELPHVEDLETNSKLPGQLTANFKAIEKEDQQDDAQLNQEIKNRKDADSRLQDQIDKLNERVGALEGQVKQLQANDEDYRKRLERIEKVLFEGKQINLTTTDTDVKHYQTRVIN